MALAQPKMDFTIKWSLKPKAIKYFFEELLFMIRHGDWWIGWEQWEDKPQFAIVRSYYDGWWFAIHIGPFHVGCHS